MDSTNIKNDKIETSIEQIIFSKENKEISVYWKYSTILELIVILWLLILLMRRKKNKNISFEERELYEARNTNIDMSDLVKSIHSSKGLYDKLSRVCHPDRFINTNLHKIAEEIFQEISKNRRNYKELERLKSEAINKLNVKL